MQRLTATLALFVLLMLRFTANAQRIIWSENFEYHYQQNFSTPWGLVNNNSQPWTCDYEYLIGTVCFPPSGNHSRVAGIADYLLPNSGPVPVLCGDFFKTGTDAVLVTPPISLAGVSVARLRYDSYFIKQAKNGKSESARVEISTDSGYTWTALKDAPISGYADGMKTSFIELNAYAGLNKPVRLGFHYSDSGQGMNGWMIDNLSVYVPADDDLAMAGVNPKDSMLGYFVAGSDVTLGGMVVNMGTKPVTTFNVQYNNGSTVQTHTVSGVNIQPLDSLSFMHAVSFHIGGTGRFALKMWTSLSNDTLRRNDTLPVVLHGAAFNPVKRLVIEEGTGTWNVLGPRGYVYLHALDATDDPPIRISVHSGDTMEEKDYADYLYYINQNFTPYFLFDRRGPVRPEVFSSTYETQRQYFGFANISAHNSSVLGRQLSLDAVIQPAVDLPGDYKVAFAVTEDGVSGTDIGYAQKNAWAGGKRGPMGGFENKPDPVPASDMKYDYVARTISPAPDGSIGCLPRNMQASGSYSCHLQTTLSPTWNRSKMNAILLLIRERDSSILNARTVAFTELGVGNVAQHTSYIRVFPNPAGTSATISFPLPSRAQVNVQARDITGRKVWEYSAGWLETGAHDIAIPTSQWSPGMYFITLHSGTEEETVKLSVVH